MRTLALLAALTLAVAGPGRAEDPAPISNDDLIVGELITLPYNRSASYGPTRVRGPKVNLTDAGDGRWKGNINQLDGVFTVTEKRISGGSFNVVVSRSGDEWTAEGTVDGKRVRFSMEPDGFVARFDDRFYDMKRVAADLWAGVPSGPGIRVKGDAGSRTPLYPQFIFALLAVL
ncbi:MAG: hypothetical protein WCK73_11525 [Deltaproteobacteria bacterium]